MPQNVGIAHVSGMISVRATESILPKIGVAGQDNITQDRTCLGVRFFREKYLKPHFGNVSWEGEL